MINNPGILTFVIALLSWLPIATCAATLAGPVKNAEAEARPTVWMVLSPRMVYALQEWRRMRVAAQTAGFAVVSVRDPGVDDDEWRAAVRETAVPEALYLPVLANPAILQLGALNHWPTSFVMSAGRIHTWPIFGVMPDSAWISLLKHRAEAVAAGK